MLMVGGNGMPLDSAAVAPGVAVRRALLVKAAGRALGHWPIAAIALQELLACYRVCMKLVIRRTQYHNQNCLVAVELLDLELR